MTGKQSRKTKALSGAKAQAYLSGLLGTEPDLSADGRERLLATCAAEIAQVRIRLSAPIRGTMAKRRGLRGAPAQGSTGATGSEPADFDPFAFSLVVVMTKEGRDGLAAKLATIADAAHLRALAKAQHVPVPEAATSRDEIIAGIVEGTAGRIAGRRAAAS